MFPSLPRASPFPTLPPGGGEKFLRQLLDTCLYIQYISNYLNTYTSSEGAATLDFSDWRRVHLGGECIACGCCAGLCPKKAIQIVRDRPRSKRYRVGCGKPRLSGCGDCNGGEKRCSVTENPDALWIAAPFTFGRSISSLAGDVVFAYSLPYSAAIKPATLLRARATARLAGN